MASKNTNAQASSKAVAESSLASDAVQKETKPKTAEEWREYEAKHIARHGALGTHFLESIGRIEEKALKEQEGREYSGDTDEEDEEEYGKDEEDEEDEEDEDSGLEEEDNAEDQQTFTEEEARSIQAAARRPSFLLGAFPGSILAERYESDSDSSEYDPEDATKVAEDDESSTASNSEEEEETDDEEINDVEIKSKSQSAPMSRLRSGSSY